MVISHHILVPLKPVAQGRARVGRWSTYYPPSSQAYRKALVAVLSEYEAIDGPVAVEVEIAGMRVNSDPDNHLKMILDGLQDAGVIESDDVRTVKYLSISVVGGKPHTTINIRSLT
tara:strand:+ start:1365 stop:1712 length:348 start_codon:yes stop_codon:yes gene_type:complete